MIFSVILIVSIALAAMDFFLNGYEDKINLQANIQNIISINTDLETKIHATDSNINLSENKETKSLFSKIDLTKIKNIKNASELLFTKNNVSYFKLYTFEFKSSQNQANYLKLKELFSGLAKEESYITINEVNNYGKNSFYVNNTQEENMARLIILTSDTVFGIEYSKTINKESIDPLLSILTN